MAIEMGHHLPTPAEILRDFGDANDFTAVDLIENRAGRISATQMVKLGFQALTPLFSSGATLAGWFLFLYAIKTFLPGFAQGFLMKNASAGICQLQSAQSARSLWESSQPAG